MATHEKLCATVVRISVLRWWWGTHRTYGWICGQIREICGWIHKIYRRFATGFARFTIGFARFAVGFAGRFARFAGGFAIFAKRFADGFARFADGFARFAIGFARFGKKIRVRFARFAVRFASSHEFAEKVRTGSQSDSQDSRWVRMDSYCESVVRIWLGGPWRWRPRTERAARRCPWRAMRLTGRIRIPPRRARRQPACESDAMTVALLSVLDECQCASCLLSRRVPC